MASINETTSELEYYPYKYCKLLCIILALFLPLFIFIICIEDMDLLARILAAVGFVYFSCLIWLASRNLPLRVSINYNSIKMYNCKTKEEYIANLSDFKVIYRRQTGSWLFFLFSKECLEKNEAIKLYKKTGTIKNGKPVLQYNGNICLCLADHDREIISIINDRLPYCDIQF